MMASRVRLTHVYDDGDDGKYVGFFVEAKDAKAWIKTQKGRKLRISDKPPKRRQAKNVDTALDAALAAVSKEAEEAPDVAAPASQTG